MLCGTILFHCKLSEKQAVTDGSGTLVTGAINAGESIQLFLACIFFTFI